MDQYDLKKIITVKLFIQIIENCVINKFYRVKWKFHFGAFWLTSILAKYVNYYQYFNNTLNRNSSISQFLDQYVPKIITKLDTVKLNI